MQLRLSITLAPNKHLGGETQKLILQPTDFVVNQSDFGDNPTFLLSFMPTESQKCLLFLNQDGHNSEISLEVLNRQNQQNLISKIFTKSTSQFIGLKNSTERFQFGSFDTHMNNSGTMELNMCPYKSILLKVTTCSKKSLKFIGSFLRGYEDAFLDYAECYMYNDGHNAMRGGSSSSSPSVTKSRVGADNSFEVQKIKVCVPVKFLDNHLFLSVQHP